MLRRASCVATADLANYQNQVDLEDRRASEREQIQDSVIYNGGDLFERWELADSFFAKTGLDYQEEIFFLFAEALAGEDIRLILINALYAKGGDCAAKEMAIRAIEDFGAKMVDLIKSDKEIQKAIDEKLDDIEEEY